MNFRIVCFFAYLINVLTVYGMSQQNDFINNLLNDVLKPDPINEPSSANNDRPTKRELSDILINTFKPDVSGTSNIDDFFSNLIEKTGLLNQPLPQKSSNCECVPRFQCQDVRQKNVANIPGVGNVVDLRTHECFPSETCCKIIGKSGRPIIEQSINSEPKVSCGTRNPLGVDELIAFFQDNQSQYGEFTWTAAVLQQSNFEDKLTDGFECGGSLIHPQVVLSVAHCIERLSSFAIKVRLGEWNFESNSEKYPHIDVNVARTILHPNYSRETLNYNVALIILENKVPIQRNINTICLPTQTKHSIDEFNCYSSGWGKDSFGKNGNYQQIMKRVHLPIVHNNQCEQALRTTKLGNQFNLHNSSICAGANGKDTCTGDGGSPLVCKLNDGSSKYVQVGIVAWGIGCNRPGIPGVYSSVLEAMPWIREQVLQIDPLGETYFTRSF